MIFTDKTTQLGDRRTRQKYAWFPTFIGQYTLWLEHYIIEEEFQRIETWDYAPRGGVFDESRNDWVIVSLFTINTGLVEIRKSISEKRPCS